MGFKELRWRSNDPTLGISLSPTAAGHTENKNKTG
jgi:hypothetical protein